MWVAITLTFTIWVAAWQIMRRRDQRLDASARLAARRRIRSRSSGKPQAPASPSAADPIDSVDQDAN